MKKVLAGIAALILLLSLSAWRTGRRPAEELKKLGIAPSLGKMTLRIDSRTGFSQKGYVKTVIEVPKSLEAQIQKDGHWKPFPMDMELQELLHTELKELGKFFPETSRGYYRVLDLSSGKRKAGSHLHLILAIYDTDRNAIYYGEVKQ